MTIDITDWTPLPMGKTVARPLFAIGDVHGAVDSLKALQEHLRDYIGGGSGGLLVYLGDYIDRGPAPLETLRAVLEGVSLAGLEEIALRGNHDQYLIDAAELEEGRIMTLRSLANWVRWGGESTLEALDVPRDIAGAKLAAALRRRLGEEMCEFLISRPMRHDEPGVTFAHAGLNPERGFHDQRPNDLTRIRRAFLEPAGGVWPHPSFVIHGHTVQRPAVHAHRIGIDIGVYRTGELAAAEMRGGSVRFHIYRPERLYC